MAMLLLFRLAGSTASLNVRTTLLFTATPVAPLLGLTLTTEGVVVLAELEVPVVKELVNGVTALPAWSVKPLTATV